MSIDKAGWPAFPNRLPNVEVRPDEAIELVKRYQGMTLRDYFAAKAMQSIIAIVYKGFESMDGEPITEVTISEQAYEFADAMLKARES